MSATTNLTHMMYTNFNVLLTHEESWYVVKCVDNNVASQGKSIEEALSNLHEALELFYEDAEQDIKQHIPSRAFLTTLEVALP